MTFEELGPKPASDRLEQYRVVDVREPSEFSGPLGHIPGAELLPLASLVSDLTDEDRNTTLLLVCRSGRRSAEACERLEASGFSDLTNLEGGMIAWNQAGLAVDRHEIGSLRELLDAIVTWFAQVTSVPPDAARSTLAQFIAESDASVDAPTVAAVDHALALLAALLRGIPPPPADLDLVLAAFRRDLAVL